MQHSILAVAVKLAEFQIFQSTRNVASKATVYKCQGTCQESAAWRGLLSTKIVSRLGVGGLTSAWRACCYPRVRGASSPSCLPVCWEQSSNAWKIKSSKQWFWNLLLLPFGVRKGTQSCTKIPRITESLKWEGPKTHVGSFSCAEEHAPWWGLLCFCWFSRPDLMLALHLTVISSNVWSSNRLEEEQCVCYRRSGWRMNLCKRILLLLMVSFLQFWNPCCDWSCCLCGDYNYYYSVPHLFVLLLV